VTVEQTVAIESVPSPGRMSRRRVLALVAAGGAATASLLVLAPALGDLPDTWARLVSGDGRWLLAALGFEAVSFLGHIVLFRAVSLDAGSRVGMRASTEITLAGHAATRLFAAGGAGGVALTAWALRRSGMERGQVAARMTTFLVLLYSVYMAALIVGGAGLYAGVLPGDAPAGLTLVPAIFGAVVIATALALPLVGGRLERVAARRGGRLARVAPAAAAVGEGVRTSLRLARRLDPGLLGALLWWGADIAVLWASFEAFGDSPAIAAVVMAYFLGMLANTLPLPGGVGGVDGGMIGALLAFGVDPSLAVVSVLAYRGFAFWLPIAPGVAAWLSLRRSVAGWEREDAAQAGEASALRPAAPEAAPAATTAPLAPEAAPAALARRPPCAGRERPRTCFDPLAA
jgi:uncharacterized membrane protein YbhN (UPF0104 family)